MTHPDILDAERFGSRPYNEELCYCKQCENLLPMEFTEEEFCSELCRQKYEEIMEM